MTGKNWLVGAALGIILASSGCVTCCDKSAKVILEAGPNCEVPLCDRQKVYAVFINGLTPFGLDGLRDRLAEYGFAKVYCGQMSHAGWLEREMIRVHTEDSAARFVVVGYDMGCSDANGIAANAIEAGVPVDAVVLIDPVATRTMRGCPARRILVTCGFDIPETPHSERCAVCGANHFTLPTHPQTVELVLDVLKQSAIQIEHPPVYEYPTERYQYAPPLRIPLPVPPELPGEWLFLEDLPGSQFEPLSPVPEPELLPTPIAPALIPQFGFPPRWTPPYPEVIPVPVPLPAPPEPQILPVPRPLP